MTCANCGRPQVEFVVSGACIGGGIYCWRARAERLEEERDEAVDLLRSIQEDGWADGTWVDAGLREFLARIDAKEPTT